MSMIETIAALFLEALLLASMSTVVAGSAVLTGVAADIGREIVARRHVEHLIDRTIASAGGGPDSPAPLADATRGSFVVITDLNGDGRIDARSAERTALELRTDGVGHRRLLHRIGRQSVTVQQGLDARATFQYFDAAGRATRSLQSVRSIVLPMRDGDLTVALRIAAQWGETSEAKPR